MISYTHYVMEPDQKSIILINTLNVNELHILNSKCFFSYTLIMLNDNSLDTKLSRGKLEIFFHVYTLSEVNMG